MQVFKNLKAWNTENIEKDGIRRQGKGRRVWLGGKICLIPCRANCFALVYLKEKVKFILFFQIDSTQMLKMDAAHQ